MKVKGSLYWIYSFTSGCKGKMLVAILLAVIGVLCGMAPYFALAGILSGLIQNTLTAERIFCYVGIAVLGETLKMLFNTVSSLKAHRVAYHILGNIRCKLAEKMMRVPMGVMVDTPSGKLKAMVVDTVDKLEQPLAHMLPEITANVFTPLCIIILLFILDWRMALACMIVIPIGVLLLMGQMKDYKNRSDRYIEASSNMDSSLVEYVNGIEVIKTFSQTGKSFQKFSDAVKNYHDTTLDWWKNTWLSSVDPENQHALLTAINELTCGKTLIIIAHRLSTIKDADQIIVLDNGHVVQQGTHETLLQQDGIYRRFVKIRQTASSWKI